MSETAIVSSVDNVAYELYRDFATTPYGEELAGHIRYARYNTAQLTNEEWVRLLGADVNNLTHMPLTLGLAKSYTKNRNALQPESLSDKDSQLLHVAAAIHDQGEAIKGDISFGDKTTADEDEEHKIFKDNLLTFSPQATDEVKKLIIKARDEIVFDPTTRLGEMFNSVERLGYLRTALRAARHLENTPEGQIADGLRWIVADVLLNQPITLVLRAQTDPVVNQYLSRREAEINRAFLLVQYADFQNYPTDQQEQRRNQFIESFAVWAEWTSQSSN